ncbi:MAG: sulfurtransferase TusA family protein [Rhodospirillaceae bacterium]
MADTHLDMKGLNCPLPVLKANKAIRAMTAGETLTVEVTDPAAPEDFANFCDTAGHALVSCDEAGAGWTIALRKGG